MLAWDQAAACLFQEHFTVMIEQQEKECGSGGDFEIQSAARERPRCFVPEFYSGTLYLESLRKLNVWRIFRGG